VAAGQSWETADLDGGSWKPLGRARRHLLLHDRGNRAPVGYVACCITGHGMERDMEANDKSVRNGGRREPAADIRTQIREIFLDEAATLVDELESSVLELERNPASQEMVNAAFRAAHTIKGSAAGVGLTPVAAFTHRLEDALDAFRTHRCDITPERIAVLLEAVDLLRLLLDAERRHAPPPDTTACEQRVLTAFLVGESWRPSPPPTPAAPEASRSATPVLATLATLSAHEVEILRDEVGAGASIYSVCFWLPEDAFEWGLDPLALQIALHDEARIIRAVPLIERVPTLETLDPSRCYLGFANIVATRASDVELREIFEFCPESSFIEVTRVPREQLAEAKLLDGGSGDTRPELASVSQQVAAEHQPPAATEDEAPAHPPKGTGAPTPLGDEGRTIRVKQSRLDSLINLAGELVITRNALLHLQRTIEVEYDLPELTRRMKDTTAVLSRSVMQLQANVLSLRMVPVRLVLQRLPRVVRDVASRTGKQVTLHLRGEETEVDKTVADALVDPLVHVVRNAVDHGIEDPQLRAAAGKSPAGGVWIDAWREGNSVVIEVRDDGRGIDPARVRQAAVARGLIDRVAAEHLTDKEAIDLIFTAGLSTASTVSDISGRGVGMDVVRSTVVRIGGTVHVSSAPGKGTAVRIQVPLTLSLCRALVVRVGRDVFALPLDAVRYTAAVLPHLCRHLAGQMTALIKGELVGLVRLTTVLGFPDADGESGARGGTSSAGAGEEAWSVVVIGRGSDQIGLIVDALEQPQEIMVKPVDGYLSGQGVIAGASIMGDGSIALVLDPAGLIDRALTWR
jgi:two-component system chemotaxis sensor kinase CheA